MAESAGRTEQVNARFSEKGLAKIDECRGTWSRSEYIRQAVAYAVGKGMKGPEKVEW